MLQKERDLIEPRRHDCEVTQFEVPIVWAERHQAACLVCGWSGTIYASVTRATAEARYHQDVHILRDEESADDDGQ